MASFQSSTSHGYKLSLDVSEPSTSTANNSSGVNWALRIVATGNYCQWNPGPGSVTVSINGKQVYSGTPAMVFPGKNSTITLCSGSMTVAHNADGSKTIACSAKYTANSSADYLPGTMSCSGNFVLTNLPRATTPSFSSNVVAVGSSVTITLPRAVSTFKHIVMYHMGDVSGFISHEAGESVTWTVPEELLDAMPNSTSGVCDIEVQTYTSDDGYIGTKDENLTVTVPDSYKPIIDSITVTEATAGLASQFGAFVQSKSTLKIVVSSAASNGASIRSCNISVSGYSYTGTDVTTGVINTSGDVEIKVAVTDSRGKTTTSTKTIDVKAYAAPKIKSATVTRADVDGTSNDEGTYARCAYSYVISDVNESNPHSFKIQYKSGDAWIDLTETTEYTRSGVYISTDVFDVDQEYDFRFIVSDYFATYTIDKRLDMSYELMSWGSDGRSFAVGCHAKREGAFENALPYYMGPWSEALYTAGTNGKSGWVKLMTMTIASAWVNSPIEVMYSQRSLYMPVKLSILFNSVGTMDPDLRGFTFAGGSVTISRIKLIKEAASKWSLWVQKSESSDFITLHYVNASRYLQGKINFTFPDVFSTSDPGTGTNPVSQRLYEDLRVGTILQSTSSTNPGTYLGGTWEQYAQGRVLIGVGSGNDGTNSRSFSVNSTGGKYKSDQLNLSASNYGCTLNQPGYGGRTVVAKDSLYNSGSAEKTAGIDIVQPYIVVYMWRRTA